MRPESSFAFPRGSFETPQSIPTAGPTDSPTVQICINEQWLPLIAGCLKQLLLDATWDAPTHAVLWAVQAKAFNLIDLFNLSVATEGDCVAVQFRQPDICTLQVSLDGGATWATIYDATTCVVNGVNDGIQQRLNDGTLAGGGQQPPAGGGIGGHCYDYSLTILGNNRWIAPIAVGADDVITVSLATGAWAGANVLPTWYCPDGSQFILGLCTGVGVLVGGDPLPTVNHMRLIGNLPADATTPFFDLYDRAYTVPAGVASGNLILQANDSDLTDNQGSINLHVQICKGVVHWSYEEDWCVSSAHWHVLSGGLGPQGVFDPGDCCYYGTGGTSDRPVVLWLGWDASEARHLTRITITLQVVNWVQSFSGGHFVTVRHGGGTNTFYPLVGHVDGSTFSGTFVIDLSGATDPTINYIEVAIDGNSGARTSIDHIKVEGDGALPTLWS